MKNMQKIKADIVYYVVLFFTLSLVIVIYSWITSLSSERTFIEGLIQYRYVSLFITIIAFVYRKLGWSMTRRFNQNKKEDDFVIHMSQMVKNRLKYSIEDFRQLRENQRFQKMLFDSYKIYLNGETEEMNYDVLKHKFTQGTKEYDATLLIIEEIKKLKR
jgi:hypothetical protein